MRYLTGDIARLILLSSSVLCLGDAWAASAPADRMFDSVSVYSGQGINHNLKEIPGKILGGNLDWDSTYFTAVGFSNTRGSLASYLTTLQDTVFAPVRSGYEIVVAQHRGLQSDTEFGAVYTLRSPALHVGLLSVDFMAGAGLSYALGTPSYEDGSTSDPERRYRTQFLGLFELEWQMQHHDNFSLVTRTHHRSGIYGLIAPQHVGSNFLAIGIRYKF